MTMLDDRPDAAEDEVESAPEGPDGPDGPDRDDRDEPFRRWRANLPLLVVIVLAWMVAAGAFVLWRQNQDLRDERADRRAVAAVAVDFTTAVLSYDFRDLRGSVDDVRALSTTDWGRQYEDAWFQEQQSIVEATRARARVAVDEESVLLGDGSDGVVPVMVRFDATIRSEVGVRRLQGGYLHLEVTRQDGEWKVDDMRYVAATEQQLDPADGSGGGGGN